MPVAVSAGGASFLLERMPKFHAPTNVNAWRRTADQLRRKALDEIYLAGWPEKANELHVDPHAMETVLDKHVRRHLAELSEIRVELR